MKDRTFKLIELVGSSDQSIQQAVRNAIKRASKSLKGISWFEVTQIRGQVADGEVSQFQVTLKVGFRIMDEGEMAGS
jgi:flavin-binding protein dodecin